MLLLLLQLGEEEPGLRLAMLLPGIRLVDRPGVLHFFDGRRVVSLRGGEGGREAVRQALRTDPQASGDDADPAAVQAAHDLLVRLRLGTDARAPGRPVPLAASFASAAVAGWTSPHDAADRLSDTELYVWDAPDGGLLRALGESGLSARPIHAAEQISELDPQRSIVAVVASDEQPAQRLRAANVAALDGRIPWLPVGAYDGAVLHVGPLFVPGQTACAECLLRRLAANVAYADQFADIVDAPAAPTPAALRAWAYSIATLVLLRWIANRDAQLPSRLLTLQPDDMTIRQAAVLRIPRCPACAAPDFVTAAAPWSTARDH
jgi:bacteriocin biosynthesis cyclodehydratase domain-containing protein